MCSSAFFRRRLSDAAFIVAPRPSGGAGVKKDKPAEHAIVSGCASVIVGLKIRITASAIKFVNQLFNDPADRNGVERHQRRQHTSHRSYRRRLDASTTESLGRPHHLPSSWVMRSRAIGDSRRLARLPSNGSSSRTRTPVSSSRTIHLSAVVCATCEARQADEIETCL